MSDESAGILADIAGNRRDRGEFPPMPRISPKIGGEFPPTSRKIGANPHRPGRFRPKSAESAGIFADLVDIAKNRRVQL